MTIDKNNSNFRKPQSINLQDVDGLMDLKKKLSNEPRENLNNPSKGEKKFIDYFDNTLKKTKRENPKQFTIEGIVPFKKEVIPKINIDQIIEDEEKIIKQNEKENSEFQESKNQHNKEKENRLEPGENKKDIRLELNDEERDSYFKYVRESKEGGEILGLSAWMEKNGINTKTESTKERLIQNQSYLSNRNLVWPPREGTPQAEQKIHNDKIFPKKNPLRAVSPKANAQKQLETKNFFEETIENDKNLKKEASITFEKIKANQKENTEWTEEDEERLKQLNLTIESIEKEIEIFIKQLESME